MANFIAIDLDSQGLYAVSGTTRGGAKVTHAFSWNGDSADAPTSLTPDTAKAIGEKLRDKLRAAGVPPALVIVSIGRDRVILKELKYPPVPPTEEPALVRFQAMKEMSESPDDVVLDYAPLGDANGERRSMAVVMRKEFFGAIQAMCQAAGLKLMGVTPRPYAAAAGLTRAIAVGITPPPADKGDAVAALTLSSVGGEFTVVRRGEVTFTLAIPAPVVASETMLVAQIRRNLTMYAGQHPGHPITAVYLSEVGGPWAERLSDSLNVPVHAFDPLAGAVPEIEEQLRGRFAGAVGLLAGRSADALPINFAAPRQPRTESDPAKKKLTLAALAAMLFLAAGLGAGIFYANNKTDRVRQLTQQRDDLKDQTDRGAPDTTRLKAIDAWSKREVNWLDEMYEMADRMPKDDSVRVLSLDAKPIPPDRTGKQDSQATLELKLAATSTAAGTNLSDAFVRDNPTQNKYYVGTMPSYPGLLTGSAGSSKHKESVVIRMKVNRREPNEYVQNTRFAPLKRTAGAAGVVTLPPPVTAAIPLEVAPPPTEKVAKE